MPLSWNEIKSRATAFSGYSGDIDHPFSVQTDHPLLTTYLCF